MFREFLRKIQNGLNTIETHPLEGGEFNPAPGSGIVWRGVFGDASVAFISVNPDDLALEGTLFALNPVDMTVRELGKVGRLHSQPAEGTIVVMKF